MEFSMISYCIWEKSAFHILLTSMNIFYYDWSNLIWWRITWNIPKRGYCSETIFVTS
jgi:hypothetical protein